jgi:hypothetical protein
MMDADSIWKSKLRVGFKNPTWRSANLLWSLWES